MGTLNGIDPDAPTPTTERQIFRHGTDCPAIERLQADRSTMKASGPCNCWHEQLTTDLEGAGVACIRRRPSDTELERIEPTRVRITESLDELDEHMPIEWRDEGGADWRLRLGEVNEAVWRYRLHEVTANDGETLVAYGFVKWDGCSDTTIGTECMWHGCDERTFRELAAALERAYWACAHRLGDRWDLGAAPPELREWLKTL